MSVNNRDHDRHGFKPKMWVKVIRSRKIPTDFKMYRLIDISKSGISFIINSPTEFKRHDTFYILEVEGRILPKPLKAKVKYVAVIDDFGVDFKVGSEFVPDKQTE